MNEPSAPFDAQDERRLSDMVQEGFRAWKDFHDRFGEQQKSIKRQNPGLLTWEDVVFFLEGIGGAKRLSGHKRQRFERQGKAVTYVSEDAPVLTLADGRAYVCGEQGEELVYGPDGSITPKLGLNLKPVSELLRKYAFPDQACGAAHLRWPTGTDLPSCVHGLPLSISAFLRQTLRMDRMGGWLEQGHTLHYFITEGDSTSEITGEDKRQMLRGLFHASIRKTAAPTEALIQHLMATEASIAEGLRRPSGEELTNQIRHAVTPLFAAIIVD